MLLFLVLVEINNLLTTIVGILSNVTIILFAYIIRDQHVKDVRASIAAHAIVNLALTIVYTALQLVSIRMFFKIFFSLQFLQFKIFLIKFFVIS